MQIGRVESGRGPPIRWQSIPFHHAATLAGIATHAERSRAHACILQSVDRLCGSADRLRADGTGIAIVAESRRIWQELHRNRQTPRCKQTIFSILEASRNFAASSACQVGTGIDAVVRILAGKFPRSVLPIRAGSFLQKFA